MVTLKPIWMRKSAVGLMLAGCLISPLALSQEIIKWVDEAGVTHFGHPATANHKKVQVHSQPDAKPAMKAEEGHNTKDPDVTMIAIAAAQNGVGQTTPKSRRTP